MPESSKTYQPFDSEASEYELAAPTNARVKRLMRLELRGPNGGTAEQRKSQAEALGLDPDLSVPLEENDLPEFDLFAYLTKATGVVLDIDTEGKSDDLRMDVAQEAIGDFISNVGLTNSDIGTL